MLSITLFTCTLAPDAGSRISAASLSRRSVLGGALAAVGAPASVSAVIKGTPVDDAEAAAVGAVGLWIDLDGCSVCRKGLPATCTGTLIAPDLVLSAQHCIDIPKELNGTLDRVIFGANMFKKGVPERRIQAYKTTSEYGFPPAQGGDLVLIKLTQPAPAAWRPVELPLGLLPNKAEQDEAKRKDSPFYPDGVGLPAVSAYGFGEQSTRGTQDADYYASGVLKKVELQLRTEVRPWAPGFLPKPVTKGEGTCAGDSGGPALLRLQDPQGRGVRQLVLGVQAEASVPCEDNQQLFIYPDYFKEFIVRASADLGSPIRPTLNWREYSS